MLKGKTIAIDFDGVLNSSQGWKEGEPIPEPMPGAVDFLQNLNVVHGAKVIIFTCREIGDVWNWLDAHKLVKYVANVTNTKPPAFAYLDDRAICFTGDFVSALDQLNTFEPHWVKDKNRIWTSRQHD